MSFMEKMERQWTERTLGVEHVSVSASARVTGDADRAWGILTAPELAHLTDPAVVTAFHVPGTPLGEVGEQQCFIRDEGEGRRSVTLTEVVEVERPVRVVVACPTYPVDCTTTYELRLEGTALILSCKMDLVVERGLRRRIQPSLQTETQSMLDRIAAVIRSGLTLPSSPSHSPVAEEAHRERGERPEE